MTPEEPQTPQPRRMPGPKNPQEAEEWARHIMAAQYSQEEAQQLREISKAEAQCKKSRALVEFQAMMRGQPPAGRS